MSGRLPTSRRAPLPLAPMVNIVFLLLAVFIIGGVLGQRESWPVVLPQSVAAGTPVANSARRLAVVLDGERVLVDGVAVPSQKLEAALAGRLEASGGQSLLVADAFSDAFAFLRLMEVLRKTGYLRVELLMRRASAGS